MHAWVYFSPLQSSFNLPVCKYRSVENTAGTITFSGINFVPVFGSAGADWMTYPGLY